MIDKNDVFVSCGLGQHADPHTFSHGCNACLTASLAKLVALINAQEEDKNPKKPK